MVSGIGNRYTFVHYNKNYNNNILLRDLGEAILEQCLAAENRDFAG